MADKTRNLSIGARNPYALAELIQGKKINWKNKSYDRSISTLENAFGMPAERLFNPKYNSPIFSNHIPEIKIPSVHSGSSWQLMACSVSDWQQYEGNYITAAGMEGVDPVQSGLLKNCSLIAAMASCAWTGKGAWYKSVTQNQVVQSTYSLQFYDYSKPINPVQCSWKLPQVPKGTLIYAKSNTAGECWPAIIEKAYYQSRESLAGTITDAPDMEKYNPETINPTGVPAAVLYQLLGVNTDATKRSDADGNYTDTTIWNTLVSIGQGSRGKLKMKYPAVAYSYKTNGPASPIPAAHSYSILGVTGTLDTSTPPKWTSRYIVLRDPWAVTTDPPFSSNEMLTTGTWIQGIDFAKKDGIFALRADLFPAYFQGYAWAVC